MTFEATSVKRDAYAILDPVTKVQDCSLALDRLGCISDLKEIHSSKWILRYLPLLLQSRSNGEAEIISLGSSLRTYQINLNRKQEEPIADSVVEPRTVAN